jgi:hypothetical protein
MNDRTNGVTDEESLGFLKKEIEVNPKNKSKSNRSE